MTERTLVCVELTQHCKAAVLQYIFKKSFASLHIKNKGQVFFNQMKKGGPYSIILNHEISTPGSHGPCTGLFFFCETETNL